MAKKEVTPKGVSQDVEMPDIATVTALYRYNPNTKWIASYLGIDEYEVIGMYGSYLDKLDPDKNKAVEFVLYYLATAKQDIRAVLAWLEVNDPRYGKGASDTDVHTLKLDILAHLSAKLPG